MTPRPSEGEYAPFYAGYISLVPEDDVLTVLREQVGFVDRFAASVPLESETYRYAPGKWSVREVVGHVLDGERVFGHRVFAISRGDETPLAGFDEKSYVAASGYDGRPLAKLARELGHVREANVSLLEDLDPSRWERSGIANGTRVSVRALAYIMAGHFRHHMRVLRERYGLESG